MERWIWIYFPLSWTVRSKRKDEFCWSGGGRTQWFRHGCLFQNRYDERRDGETAISVETLAHIGSLSLIFRPFFVTVNSSYLRNVGYSSLIYQVLIVAYVFSYLIIFYKIFFFYCSFNLFFLVYLALYCQCSCCLWSLLNWNWSRDRPFNKLKRRLKKKMKVEVNWKLWDKSRHYVV